MRYLILPALLAVAQLPQSAFADSVPLLSGWRPYVDIHLWEASDAVEVKQFESDWSTGFSPDEGRNDTLLRYRAGAGVENGSWSIGLEARHEASLDTDRETLELVRLYKQKTDPASDTRFNARVRFVGWSAHGLRVGHAFDGPAILGRTPRIRISGAYYTKPRLRENEVAGSVAYSQGEYSFNASQTDANNRYVYPFMRHTPSASGASLSVAMDLPLTESLSLKLKFEDLWSRIKWDNLPVMQRTINSDVTGRDAEGYINYRPLLSGMNRQVSRNFSIPRANSAMLSYRSGAWGAAAHVERWSGVTIPTLSLTRHYGWGNVTANVETRFKTVGLGMELGKFRLMVQADKLRLDEAKARALHLSYSIATY